MTKIKYPIGGYAPGNYFCKCQSCSEDFTGDKRSNQCEPCAINALNENNSKAQLELYKLKKALVNIKISNEIIKNIIT